LTGMDLHPQALSHAAQVAGDAAHLTQAHLHRLPWPDDAFALLLALDALDQRGVRLTLALREAWRVLAADGVLLLRVSACPRLLGPHDAAFNTGRRYARRTLDQALRRAGFTPERVTYANSALAAPIAALRLLQRWRLLPFAPYLYTTPAIDALLVAALRCEVRWLRWHDLPAGLSLYVAARKSLRAQPVHSLRIPDTIGEPSHG
ncbi:MAG: methyltransferase domain-containing protein, partial [Chloroflexota bacterium]|nr:methyltransferase domain-containing protein [Chloroflexota bacterium]